MKNNPEYELTKADQLVYEAQANHTKYDPFFEEDTTCPDFTEVIGYLFQLEASVKKFLYCCDTSRFAAALAMEKEFRDITKNR